ncbi:unnamed protein product [Spodoptera exigua]|nr:unnamed protein product [Spodoptera exigua]
MFNLLTEAAVPYWLSIGNVGPHLSSARETLHTVTPDTRVWFLVGVARRSYGAFTVATDLRSIPDTRSVACHDGWGGRIVGKRTVSLPDVIIPGVHQPYLAPSVVFFWLFEAVRLDLVLVGRRATLAPSSDPRLWWPEIFAR